MYQGQCIRDQWNQCNEGLFACFFLDTSSSFVSPGAHSYLLVLVRISSPRIDTPTLFGVAYMASRKRTRSAGILVAYR